MATTRAKFRVQQVFENKYADREGNVQKHAEEVRLSPVYSDDPESENKAFWEATPSGQISMYINNKEAWGKFVEGAEFFVDFTPANE